MMGVVNKNPTTELNFIVIPILGDVNGKGADQIKDVKLILDLDMDIVPVIGVT